MSFALKYRPEVAVLSSVHLTVVSAPGSGIGGSNEVTPRSGPVYWEQAGDKENGKTSECDKWELFYNIGQSRSIWPRPEKTGSSVAPLTLRLVPSSATVSFIVPLSSNMLWCPWMEDMKLATRITVNFCENSRLLDSTHSAMVQFLIFLAVLGETWVKCVTQLCG